MNALKVKNSPTSNLVIGVGLMRGLMTVILDLYYYYKRKFILHILNNPVKINNKKINNNNNK